MSSLARLWVVLAFSTALSLCVAARAQATETGDLERLRAEALSLLNEARREQGLAPLGATESLEKAAQAHAEDMLERGYYDHVSPEGETVRDRYLDEGGSRWKRVAENIAQCRRCASPPNPERLRAFHDGWMDSPPHRKNILGEGLESFGFGIAGAGDRIYAVQTFAGPGTSPGLAPGERPVALSPEAQVEQAVEAINSEREREGLAPIRASSALAQVARLLLPENRADNGLIGREPKLFELLPEEQADAWRRLDLLAAGCGGCGVTPNAADIRYFVERWLEDPRYRSRLLDPEVSHLGIALRADGDGRKVAAAIAGQRR